MYQKAVVSRGNQSRLVKALRKAKAGQKITVGFIGGSITAGCNAVPKEENSYARLTYKWFINTFGEETVKYINAGIGATDSYLGVHRVEKDLLKYDPDIVIVEFAVNDDRKINVESYDSLVRKIYRWDSAPAVILLFLTQRNGADNQKVQEKIGAYYDFPMISYRNAIIEDLSDGSLRWSQIASNHDDTHPENTGHFIIASLLILYLKEALALALSDQRIKEQELKSPYTKDIYRHAKIVNNTNCYAKESEFFHPAKLSNAPFKNGFRTTAGGRIIFELYGKNMGIIYYGTQDGLSGKYDVLVDGEKRCTIDADFVGRWGSYADYKEFYRSDEEKVHIVEIRRAKDSRQDYFTILGFTIS